MNAADPVPPELSTTYYSTVYHDWARERTVVAIVKREYVPSDQPDTFKRVKMFLSPEGCWQEWQTPFAVYHGTKEAATARVADLLASLDEVVAGYQDVRAGLQEFVDGG